MQILQRPLLRYKSWAKVEAPITDHEELLRQMWKRVQRGAKFSYVGRFQIGIRGLVEFYLVILFLKLKLFVNF